MKKSRLKVGDKVTYIPTDIVKVEPENCTAINIPNNGAFVTVRFNGIHKEVSVQHLRPGWNYKEPEPSDSSAADDYLDYLDSRY